MYVIYLRMKIKNVVCQFGTDNLGPRLFIFSRSTRNSLWHSHTSPALDDDIIFCIIHTYCVVDD